MEWKQILNVIIIAILFFISIYLIFELKEKNEIIYDINTEYVFLKQENTNLEKTRYILVNNYCIEKGYSIGFTSIFDYLVDDNLIVNCFDKDEEKITDSDSFRLRMK